MNHNIFVIDPRYLEYMRTTIQVGSIYSVFTKTIPDKEPSFLNMYRVSTAANTTHTDSLTCIYSIPLSRKICGCWCLETWICRWPRTCSSGSGTGVVVRRRPGLTNTASCCSTPTMAVLGGTDSNSSTSRTRANPGMYAAVVSVRGCCYV